MATIWKPEIPIRFIRAQGMVMTPLLYCVVCASGQKSLRSVLPVQQMAALLTDVTFTITQKPIRHRKHMAIPLENGPL